MIDEQAKRSFLHADKRSLIIQLGINIPIRDMRLLDFNLLSSGALRACSGHGRGAAGPLPPPQLGPRAHLAPLWFPFRSSPNNPSPTHNRPTTHTTHNAETGKLLVRDNAIILSIEHVRLIITADKVLVPREGYEHNPLRCGVLVWVGWVRAACGCVGTASAQRQGCPPARMPQPCSHDTPPHLPPCSNRFVDVLEESIAEWVRQQHAHTRPVSIADGGHHLAGQLSDFEDDHSSEGAWGPALGTWRLWQHAWAGWLPCRSADCACPAARLCQVGTFACLTAPPLHPSTCRRRGAP